MLAHVRVGYPAGGSGSACVAAACWISAGCVRNTRVGSLGSTNLEGKHRKHNKAS